MHPHAGGWDLSKAPALAWSDGDLWNVALDLEAGAFVIQFQAGVCVWRDGGVRGWPGLGGDCGTWHSTWKHTVHNKKHIALVQAWCTSTNML